MSGKEFEDIPIDKQMKKGEEEKKSHFIIPNEEVVKVDHTPRSIPQPREINHVTHGKELEKGLCSIKEKRKDTNSPIKDDVIIFKVEISDEDKIDARGDFEKLFVKNNLKVNAVKKSNIAVVSSTLKNFEDFNSNLNKYIQSDGKQADFFQYINKISIVSKEDKQATSLIEEKSADNSLKQDVQITLVPSLDKDIYIKVLNYLKEELKKSNGELVDEPFYLSDNTPILRAILPSSGVDLLSDQEIVHKIELTPFYGSESNGKIEELDVSKVELRYENEIEELPLVCILDDGIRLPENLSDCVAGYWVADDIKTFTAEHGTKVASRAIFGDEIDKNVLENKALTPRVRVIDAVISDGASKIPEPVLIERIREAVIKIKDTTKIFNLSFNAKRPIKDEEVSNLAYELDRMMEEFGVLFVVPTGNHELWSSYDSLDEIIDDEGARMAAPGEAFLGLTVGAITRNNHHLSVSNEKEIAPFSRVGLGFCGTPKPDLAYPGGNVFLDNGTPYIAGNSAAYTINNKGFLEAGYGTSFAAPIAAADIAILAQQVPNKNPFVAKALLLHHAELSEAMSNLHTSQQVELCEKLYGKGIGSEKNAKHSRKGRATYIRTGTMSRLVKERVKFYMPSTMATHSKRKTSVVNVKVTCLCISPVSKNMGYEYVRAYVETSFHCINSNGKDSVRNPGGGMGRTKWHNIHHFSQDFSVFDSGDWQVWLHLFSKPEIENKTPIKYILIVTIEDLTEHDVDIYGGIQAEAIGRFHVLNEVEVDKVEAEVEIDVDDIE